MTATPKTELKPGTKVQYLRTICAEVKHVRANGVTIGFWGKGLKRDQYVTRRVSASDIEACAQ